jgi:hypothetical protein
LIAYTSLPGILALLTTQINQELPDFRLLKPLKQPELIETVAQKVGRWTRKVWGGKVKQWVE